MPVKRCKAYATGLSAFMGGYTTNKKNPVEKKKQLSDVFFENPVKV